MSQVAGGSAPSPKKLELLIVNIRMVPHIQITSTFYRLGSSNTELDDFEETMMRRQANFVPWATGFRTKVLH